jgi:hypothetical protein
VEGDERTILICVLGKYLIRMRVAWNWLKIVFSSGHGTVHVEPSISITRKLPAFLATLQNYGNFSSDV